MDHWNNHLVDKALADWGRFVTWEEDPTHLARILVKACVVSLQEIPWFIFSSEGDDFDGDTWIAQCEILQSTMLGEQPADEDDPPIDPDDVHPDLFDYFGFGQLGQGPPPPENDHMDGPNADGWGLWPDQVQGPQLPQGQNLPNHPARGEAFLEVNDLQQVEQPEEQDLLDLNMAPLDDLGGVEDLAALCTSR